jgi:hypothetical protein
LSSSIQGRFSSIFIMAIYNCLSPFSRRRKSWVQIIKTVMNSEY